MDHPISRKILKVLENRKKEFTRDLVYSLDQSENESNKLRGHITEIDAILDLEIFLLGELNDIN